MTFLGWQSWLVAGSEGRLLIDPLLTDAIGRGPAQTQQRLILQYPPRTYDFGAFPAVDAVLLSHEHEDHFHVPSLARLDRRIPIYLSDRSSIAARTILTEMGFELRLASPGEPFQVGSMEVQMFQGDYTAGNETDFGDEWDTLAYLICDQRGANFFTNVDIAVTPAMRAAVDRASCGGSVPTLSYEGLAMQIWRKETQRNLTKSSEMHRPPALKDADALELLHSGEPMQPIPGQTFIIENGRIGEVEPRSQFLWTAPKEEWGSPPRWWPDEEEEILPRCGRIDFLPEDQAELEEGLARMAEHLYGSSLFKKLLSLSNADLDGREATFVWSLNMSDEEAVFYRYDRESCAFVELPEDTDVSALSDQYAGLIVSWGTDLLALFRGEFEPRCVRLSIWEQWHPACRTSFFKDVLWLFFHPLRRPQAVLRQYRRQLAEEASDAPVVVHRR